jgi:hypothetical protein
LHYDGFTAVIEAIENRPYRSSGFSRGTTVTSVAHARVTRPERTAKVSREGYTIHDARPARELWEPLRNLKRPASKLAAELKKAGKL